MGGRRRVIVALAALGAVVIAAILAVAALADGAYRFPTMAMSPTFMPGDKAFVRDVHGDVHRGDVVIARTPGPGRQRVELGVLGDKLPPDLLQRLSVPDTGRPFEQVSRVVGIGGDHLEARGGRLYVNGAALDEPYLRPGTTTSMPEPVEVPSGYVYLLGDNRTDSRDSRAYGPVSETVIESRVRFRYWPPGKIGGI